MVGAPSNVPEVGLAAMIAAPFISYIQFLIKCYITGNSRMRLQILRQSVSLSHGAVRWTKTPRAPRYPDARGLYERVA